MSAGTTTACRDCVDDVEHCHAVWIRHLDGHEECLAVDCRLGDDAHVLILTCTDVDPACCG